LLAACTEIFLPIFSVSEELNSTCSLTLKRWHFLLKPLVAVVAAFIAIAQGLSQKRHVQQSPTLISRALNKELLSLFNLVCQALLALKPIVHWPISLNQSENMRDVCGHSNRPLKHVRRL